VVIWYLYFSRFGIFGPIKIWQPCQEVAARGEVLLLVPGVGRRLRRGLRHLHRRPEHSAGVHFMNLRRGRKDNNYETKMYPTNLDINDVFNGTM
jgi:hypothetical protein